MSAPPVFAVPPGADFAAAFAHGFYERFGGLAPLDRARIRIYVPTALAQAGIEGALADNAPAAGPLPRLCQIPGLADDPLIAPEVPAALPPLRRLLRLTQLVERFLAAKRDAGEPMAPHSAAADLAASLAQMIDQFHDAGVPLAQMDAAVATGDLTAEAARHWQQTLDFVDLVRQAWPAIRAELEAGRLDPRARQRAVIAALTEGWAAEPPAHPVLVAATTGSVGSTADLMAAVARLGNGAVVLPGLDPGTDPAIWGSAGPDHPLGPFRAFLGGLGLAPADVPLWSDVPPHSRRALLAQALRPAPVTDHWHLAGPALAADAETALADFALIEAPSPRHEAEAIAAAVRAALDEPGCTVAIISHDGALGRRIAAALEAYGIVPDDTVGRPLAQTPPGVFLRLVLEVAGGTAHVGELAGLLQHPLMRPGMPRSHHRDLARAFERAALRRGPLDHRALLPPWPAREDRPPDPERVAWRETVLHALDPLARALGEKAPLDRLLVAHRAAAERLTDDGQGTGPAIWQDADGEALQAFLDRLAEAADALGPGPVADYRALLAGWMRGETLRPKPRASHPRVAIRGPREARLETAGLTVLAGLNDGVWPGTADPGPWLSRPMHAALGLPLPERTVGLSAHDFLCGACRPRVLLTRAARAEGAPTVASRWLVRLETLLTGIDAGDAWQAAKDRGARHLAAARALTTPDRDVPRAERPRPSLPQGRRLETISVTDVEALIRDAYGVYAKRILDLKPLEPLGRPPDARERGNVLHKIVESFVRATLDWPGIDAARPIFAETVDLVLAEHVPWPDLARAWRARAARFQDWFLEAEDARRATGRPVALERAGQMAVDLPSGPVTLTAKADRIDVQHDGRARIYDYKSGAVPTDKQIKEGLNQQIHLQAAILAAGGFEDLAAMECAGGGYIGLKGSGDGGDERLVDLTPEAVAQRLDDLRHLLEAYQTGAPWVSRGRLFKVEEARDHDHLARLAEWAGEDAE